MNEQVMLYEIKSGAHPNSLLLFSNDSGHFYWNDKYFRQLDLGDYVFVINRKAPFVLFTKLASRDIPVTFNGTRTSFTDRGEHFEVDGEFGPFIRLEILEKISPPADWQWRSIGMTEIVYLNGPKINKATAKNRIENINNLHQLSENPDFRAVLESSRSNFESDVSEAEDMKALIRAALEKPEFVELREMNEFAFEKGRQALAEFEQLEVDREELHRVLEEFLTSGESFTDSLSRHTEDSLEKKLFTSIGTVVSYCDDKAANKNKFNEYPDKRVIAHTGVRQNVWVKSLLEYKISGFDSAEAPMHVKRCISYFKTPLTELTMLSDKHREMVSRKILNVAEYNSATFIDDLQKYFEQFEIRPANDANLTRIICNILYEKTILPFWFEETPATPPRTPVTIDQTRSLDFSDEYRQVITAIRTKPFVLLAGLSGTGKSRLVRTLAFQSCSKKELRGDPRKPGNFELISVRPNWHDSAELLGYITRIGGERYIVTPLLRFIAKASQHPEIPFFLCLDEMNLAPVEQYFAEFLSVVETRVVMDGRLVSDHILAKDHFSNVTIYENVLKDLGLAGLPEFKHGISLPSNFVVIGTVNMDETTHSFSRKVLDRGMTIEMNEVDLKNIKGVPDWAYPTEYISSEEFLGSATEATDVYDEFDEADDVIKHLLNINEALEGSPFKIAYRVRDEFLIYCYYTSLTVNKPDDWLDHALDELTFMKILSRIEGDSLKTRKVLEGLTDKIPDNYTKSKPKLIEMKDKLPSGYTSFWS